jgi:hypothetical protein
VLHCKINHLIFSENHLLCSAANREEVRYGDTVQAPADQSGCEESGAIRDSCCGGEENTGDCFQRKSHAVRD